MEYDDVYENLNPPTPPPKPPLRISPTGSTHSNGGNEARMEEINRIRRKLEESGLKRRKLYCHYKRLHNSSNYISIGAGGISTTLMTIAAANSVNPAVFLPLSIIGASFGLVSGISTGLTKLFSKRFRKHNNIGLMANTTLCNINQMLSESLRDYRISHKEFTMINNIYQDFLRNCKNTKDGISRQNLIEKEELLRTVTNIVKTQFK